MAKTRISSRKLRSDSRQIEKKCPRCGDPFWVQPSRANAVYCSDACKFNLPGYRRELTLIKENGIVVKKRCIKCGVIKALSDFSRQAKSVLGLRGRCKRCLAEDGKQYFVKNRDAIHARERAYRAIHRTEQNAKRVQCNAAIRSRVIEAYGGACACCGESEPFFLTIDHINNDGSAHRQPSGAKWGGISLYRLLIKENFPKDRFQLLCFNCNCAKGFWGQCPHAKTTGADGGLLVSEHVETLSCS